ncbi:helix-turn-helix transcriptional regulator [Dorea sp. AM10-31]|uniref:helix-turn-helix transcriptional regulator n=1 Tax=Dorea sp. AM10-31 TaxID=2293098 RepID=UPI000E42CFF1|nr:WYL domain-containing protein [Dorea sp. AM10-31]RGF20598.1 WYL domain-containing protein [Dorea sp. AM10-31]
MEKEIKLDRVMELFFRAMKGESLSVQQLAFEYNVSTRSITRDINSLKAFLADHADILGYAELEYSSTNHCYSLKMDHFLSNKELLAITKVLIGSRAFSSEELLGIIQKLKVNTTSADRIKLEQLICKEIYQYDEVGSDCHSVIDNLWKVTDCIENRNVITITYYKMNRDLVKRKIKPVSIMFSEYYFYLIGYRYETDVSNMPIYFRVDRIVDIIVHREKYVLLKEQNIDEGMLRRKSQFMWPGPTRKIRFEFSGPSVQAILDRIPTAKVTDRQADKSIIEAEVFGSGIKMFLLSQGAWVKVLAPDKFVEEMKLEIEKMQEMYK